MENTIATNYSTIFGNRTSLNDADLVVAAQNGDLEAFNQIVLLYQDRIFNLALRISGDADSAEDITQHTFLAAYRSLSRFRNGPLRPWLYRIATNACYDELRRRKRHQVVSLELEDEREEFFLRFDHPSESQYMPEKECERHELDQIIQQGLNRLDADQRAVIVLVDLQDVDYKEASKILGVPVGTIKSRVARARNRLGHFLSISGGIYAASLKSTSYDTQTII